MSNGSEFSRMATGDEPERTRAAQTERPMSPWGQAAQEFKCDPHPSDRVVITVYIASNGTRHYRSQCLECGEMVAALKKGVGKGLYLASQLMHAIPFDDTIRTKRYELIRVRAEELECQKKDQWFVQYDAYLRSPEWDKKRKAVLERDKYLCQGCLSKRAVQAHHLTYAHVGNEFLFELIAVCIDCHRRIHP